MSKAGAPEVKTRHVWMTDGRSLCDRRATVRSRNPAAVTDAEFESEVQEQLLAPACGSCLLLAGLLRRQAAAILEAAQGTVHPAAPSQAWAQLKATRWDWRLDLDEFLAVPDLDEQVRFDAIRDAVDPNTVRQLVENDRLYWERVRKQRAELTAASEEGEDTGSSKQRDDAK